MIDFVSGILIEKNPASVVVQCGGIGLELLIPLSSYDTLPASGSEVKLHSVLVVREDALTLYGFVKLAERKLFEQLIQVTGIGPKLALTALSGLPLNDLQTAISQGDIKRLSSISGIGKKMAERMVVELRDKLELTALGSAGPEAALPGPSRDAILALVALGYKQQEAAKLLDKVRQSTGSPPQSVEELVRLALSGK